MEIVKFSEFNKVNENKFEKYGEPGNGGNIVNAYLADVPELNEFVMDVIDGKHDKEYLKVLLKEVKSRGVKKAAEILAKS